MEQKKEGNKIRITEKEKSVLDRIRELDNGRITIFIADNNIIRGITEKSFKFQKKISSQQTEERKL